MSTQGTRYGARNQLYEDITEVGKWLFEVGAPLNPSAESDFTMYFDTDTGNVYRSDNGFWTGPLANFSTGGGGGAILGGKNAGTPLGVGTFDSVDGSDLVFKSVNSDNASINVNSVDVGADRTIDLSVNNAEITITPTQAGLSNVVNTKHNFFAIAQPNTGDNLSAGWSVGSTWWIPQVNEVWGCTQSSVVEAKWTLMTDLKNNYNAVVDPVAEGVPDGYEVGSRWLNTVERTEWLLVQTDPNALWLKVSSALTDVINVGTLPAGNLINQINLQGEAELKGLTNSSTITVNSTPQNITLDVNVPNINITTAQLNPSLGNVVNTLNNYDAVVNPTNEQLPYTVGSIWVNKFNGHIFMLSDDVLPSWVDISSGGGSIIPVGPTSAYCSWTGGSGSGFDYPSTTWIQTPMSYGSILPNAVNCSIDGAGNNFAFRYQGTDTIIADITFNCTVYVQDAGKNFKIGLFEGATIDAGGTELVPHLFGDVESGSSGGNHSFTASVRKQMSPNNTLKMAVSARQTGTNVIIPLYIQIDFKEVYKL